MFSLWPKYFYIVSIMLKAFSMLSMDSKDFSKMLLKTWASQVVPRA